ncbi:hypothetical protein X747_05430 [Mesorhizobium sp. LNJC384A00]|nr:hypothetical protein X747_05430 [Mesorhizobium sp. LNJC384A00]
MICGTTTVNFIEGEAEIEFDQPLDVTAGHDVLLLETPNGGYLSLYPICQLGNGLLVSAEATPGAYRRFKLELIEGQRWRLKIVAGGI